MATTITVQSLLRNGDSETLAIASASGAFNPGDVFAIGDGRVGIVCGLEAVASGDPFAARVYGQFDLKKNATSDTYAVGASVWWDNTNHVAKTAYATGYLFAGTCVKTSANGDTYVYTDLNMLGGVNTVLPPVTITAASVTLDSTYYNRIVVLDKATGVAVTMPAATGSGARLKFINKTLISGGTTTLTRAGSDVYYANIFQLKNAAAVATYSSTTATVFTLDGSTKGGVAGESWEMIDMASGIWLLNATLTASGTVATPLT
jgi:hypothetical protein